MTEKACRKCHTLIEAGKWCPNCGQQLYPDVGETIWRFADCMVKLCEKPKFDVWTGKKVKGGS